MITQSLRAELLSTRKTPIIKFETKIYQGYQFCCEEHLLGLYFPLKSHKTADFTQTVLSVCGLVRYREK